MQKRKSFPPDIEAAVLVKCRRRCALCFGLDGDLGRKTGQIAHIDRDSANDSPENAAYLCTKHHDEYDSVPSQTKRFTPGELKAYQASLYEILESPDWWRLTTQVVRHGKGRNRSKSGVSLAVYERRLPIYRATIQFIRGVVKDLNPELEAIFQFSTETEEALFLFDETVAEYLWDMYKKALRLRTIRALKLRGEMKNRDELIQGETALAVWFTSQYDIIRRHFAPFLRLTS